MNKQTWLSLVSTNSPSFSFLFSGGYCMGLNSASPNDTSFTAQEEIQSRRRASLIFASHVHICSIQNNKITELCCCLSCSVNNLREVTQEKTIKAFLCEACSTSPWAWKYRDVCVMQGWADVNIIFASLCPFSSSLSFSLSLCSPTSFISICALIHTFQIPLATIFLLYAHRNSGQMHSELYICNKPWETECWRLAKLILNAKQHV